MCMFSQLLQMTWYRACGGNHCHRQSIEWENLDLNPFWALWLCKPCMTVRWWVSSRRPHGGTDTALGWAGRTLKTMTHVLLCDVGQVPQPLWSGAQICLPVISPTPCVFRLSFFFNWRPIGFHLGSAYSMMINFYTVLNINIDTL